MLTVFIFLVNSGKSQDLLIKNNGDTIRAKILEITDEAVRYKKTNNLDGPTFVTNKTELSKLVYANGSEEKIEVTSAPQIRSSETNPKSTEPTIDIRNDVKEKKSSSAFETITTEPFGYYYKGMRMNDTRLQNLFRSYGDAGVLSDLKTAKSNNTASKITGLVSIPFAVGGVLLPIMSFIPVEEYDNYNGYTTTRPFSNLLGPGIALFVGFIGLEVTSIVLKATYKAKLKKTVNHYNSLIAKHDLK